MSRCASAPWPKRAGLGHAITLDHLFSRCCGPRMLTKGRALRYRGFIIERRNLLKMRRLDCRDRFLNDERPKCTLDGVALVQRKVPETAKWIMLQPIEQTAEPVPHRHHPMHSFITREKIENRTFGEEY